jgi:hypothetical protein
VSHINDFLTPAVIAQRLEPLRESPFEKYEPLSAARMKRLFLKPTDRDPHFPKGNDPSFWTRHLMDLAVFEYAAGTDPQEVRKIYHEAAAIWEPIIRVMNLKPHKQKAEIGDNPALAKELRSAFGAKLTRQGRDYTAEYVARPQPFYSEVIEQALVCAAISGDFTMATRLAEGYQTNDVDPLCEEQRFVVLRHLLAGDEKAASATAKRLKPGYAKDWPPELIEFPLGALRRDSKMLAKGLRTLNTRFKGRWDEKVWHARFKNITGGPRPSWRGSWKQMLNDVRKFLMDMNWIISPYALAYLNVARWRGVTDIFEQPELFSEWIPLSLCQ